MARRAADQRRSRGRGRGSPAAGRSPTAARPASPCRRERPGPPPAAISSGAAAMPRDRSISRLSARAASETLASSASSASSPTSRTAVAARMAAMPSRRLSCSARRLSLTAAARTRATLVPQQQRDRLELRPDGRRHGAAPGGRLELADDSGQLRDNVAAAADAAADSAGRHGERPSGAGLIEPQTPPLKHRARQMPFSPASGTGNAPGHTARYFRSRPGLRISEDQRSRPRKASHRGRSRRRGSDGNDMQSRHRAIGPVPALLQTLTQASTDNSRPPAARLTGDGDQSVPVPGCGAQ